MSSFLIKLIAIITMTIDHAGFYFYGGISWMNYVGRIALPIFSWLIALGYKRTHSVQKYCTRLLIFALISQFPFYLYRKLTWGMDATYNVIWTLMIGLICLSIFDSKKIKWYVKLIIFALFCTSAHFAKLEYGIYGITMIIISYYLYPFADKERNRKKEEKANNKKTQQRLLAKQNKTTEQIGKINQEAANENEEIIEQNELYKYTYYPLATLIVSIMYNAYLYNFQMRYASYIVSVSVSTWIGSLIPLLYNGKSGWKLKWLFYLYYPTQFIFFILLQYFKTKF